MRIPDIPLTLKNCQMLGFFADMDADMDNVHYYIARRMRRRRRRGKSAMAAVPFTRSSFLTHIASRAPDFSRIPGDGVSKWASGSRSGAVPGTAPALARFARVACFLGTHAVLGMQARWRRDRNATLG